MNIKNFFKLPELLLPLCMFFPSLLIGNGTMDIHINDTYYVIDRSWLGNGFLLQSLPIILLISWLLHLLLRTKGLLSSNWRWAHVAATLLCIIILIVSFRSPVAPRRYLDVDNSTSTSLLITIPLVSLITLVVCQFIFWIFSVILIIKSRSLSKG